MLRGHQCDHQEHFRLLVRGHLLAGDLAGDLVVGRVLTYRYGNRTYVLFTTD
ncbi:unannotated protein [freshwater metagenome]|uniref:Unannotated protein n=1 Tax=freshwater metagenome TaxID=449393 RepID=A0A6J6UY67_9ZZZZ